MDEGRSTLPRPSVKEHPISDQQPVRADGWLARTDQWRPAEASVRECERVHTASYLPCTAAMDAVRGTERHTIYRLTRGRDGSYLEDMVHQAPPRESTTISSVSAW